MRKLDQVNSANLFIDVMIPRKYLEKENIFSGEEEKLRGRRRKIFGEGKCDFFLEEKKNGKGKGGKYL